MGTLNQLYCYPDFLCLCLDSLFVWLAGQQFDVDSKNQEAKRISKVLQKFGAPEITSSLTA